MKWIAARGKRETGQKRPGGTGSFAWVKFSLTGPLVLIRLVKDRSWEIRSQGDFYGSDIQRSGQAVGRLDLDRAGDTAGFCAAEDSQRGATGAPESTADG